MSNFERLILAIACSASVGAFGVALHILSIVNP